MAELLREHPLRTKKAPLKMMTIYVEPELHRKIRIKAAEAEMSISGYVGRELERIVEVESK